MVWYGMVWYGMVRYGTVRYGMVWYGKGFSAVFSPHPGTTTSVGDGSGPPLATAGLCRYNAPCLVWSADVPL